MRRQPSNAGAVGPACERAECHRAQRVALAFTTASRGGRTITGNGAHVFHMRDGKVAEYWETTADQYAFDELLS